LIDVFDRLVDRLVVYVKGAALADELPKDSLSESLYSVNVKLLNRLEFEKKKVDKKNEEHSAMTAQLEELVATVSSLHQRRCGREKFCKWKLNKNEDFHHRCRWRHSKRNSRSASRNYT
jgi:hypothetical protein